MAFDSLPIMANGITVSTTASSVTYSLPRTRANTPAKIVRVAVDSGLAFIEFGVAPITCTANDILLTSAMPEVFNVAGANSFAVLQFNSTANVNITPLEF